MAVTVAPRASSLAIWSALSVVYIIWGSTYLAIRFTRRNHAAVSLRRGSIHDLGRIFIFLAATVRRSGTHFIRVP